MPSLNTGPGAAPVGLCSWCASFKGYEEVGYHPPRARRSQTQRRHHDATGNGSEAPEDSESEGEGPHSPDDMEFADEFPNSPLLDVKERSGTCLLCGKVWASFHRWALGRYGSLDRLELPQATVGFSLIYTKRFPEEGERSEDYTGYGDDGVHGRLTSLHVDVSMPDPDGGPRPPTGPSIAFQRSGPEPPAVSDMFKGQVDTPDWPQGEPYTARRRPLVADLRLFKGWKDLCARCHGDDCRPDRALGGAHLPMIRLIDVERCCLVEVPSEGVSWVALSYVWGGRPFRTLAGADLAAFMEPGALAAPWVPATIADAIRVTRGLGERHLWNDALCIVQDSDADKARFIPRMNAVYGLATLTIISAAGAGAHSGLPGARPGSRGAAEAPFEAGEGHGCWLVQSLDPPRTSVEIVADTAWSSRGWTFQEVVLSRRLLVFTPEQAYWECRRGTWREDACWEVLPPPVRAAGGDPPGAAGGRHSATVMYESAVFATDFRLDELWGGSTEELDRAYQYLVRVYSERRLTQEADGLDAFAGILRAMMGGGAGAGAGGWEFVWGLPRRFLGVALTWPSCRGAARRRTAKCKVRLEAEGGGEGEGAIVEVPFPSWSWVGWLGTVYFHEVFGYLDSEHAGLEYYALTGSGVEHIPQNTEFRAKYRRSSQSGAPRRPNKPLWRGDTKAPVTRADVPAGLLAPDMMPAVLAFWTSCAELEVHVEDEGLSVWQGDLKLRTMLDQSPPVKSGFRGPMKFIIAGRDSLEGARDCGQLRALIVRRTESGGVSREGQMTVWEEDWNALEGRRWELVFLV